MAAMSVTFMPGTVFSLTGSAQHFLRLSYVGCPLEMIPEGISCIDREIDWLLQHGAAHETVTKFGNNT